MSGGGTDSEAKAAQLGRVAMDLVWGLKRVFRRDLWNRCQHDEEAGDIDDERPSVMVVRSKDTTRGAYQLPATTRARKERCW